MSWKERESGGFQRRRQFGEKIRGGREGGGHSRDVLFLTLLCSIKAGQDFKWARFYPKQSANHACQGDCHDQTFFKLLDFLCSEFVPLTDIWGQILVPTGYNIACHVLTIVTLHSYTTLLTRFIGLFFFEPQLKCCKAFTILGWRYTPLFVEEKWRIQSSIAVVLWHGGRERGYTLVESGLEGIQLQWSWLAPIKMKILASVAKFRIDVVVFGGFVGGDEMLNSLCVKTTNMKIWYFKHQIW